MFDSDYFLCNEKNVDSSKFKGCAENSSNVTQMMALSMIR